MTSGQNLDFTDIYTNQAKIMEIFNNQEKRTGRFEKMLVQNKKAYGNRIFKRRHNEYFDHEKQDRYKTPFLRLRDHHRWNIAKLTKAQKKQEIEWLKERRKKKQQEHINYIDAYADDRVVKTSKDVIGTLQKMSDESNNIYDQNQASTSSVTKELVEALARARLDKMTSKQMVQVMSFAKKSGLGAQNRLSKTKPHNSDDSDSSAAETGRGEKTQQQNANGSAFSFEDRFRAYIGLKVQDNIEILQEKRRREFSDQVNKMLFEDIDNVLTNADFRANVDSNNPGNMLADLTHQFIHQSIQIGAKNAKKQRKAASSLEKDKDQQQAVDQFSTIETAECRKSRTSAGAKTRSSGNKRSSTTAVDPQMATLDLIAEREKIFCPNLGINFNKVKSLQDIKDKESLFYKVQFVLEHCDKERYKKLRGGVLSLTQCISRIEAEQKNGLKYNVLDDLRDQLEPDALKKPSKAIMTAYYHQVAEDRLMRIAKKRGIDPVILKKTARNLRMQERCAKSMYAQPKEGVSLEMQQRLKNSQNEAEKVRARKKEIDEKRQQDKELAFEKKAARAKSVLDELRKQDPREIFRDSLESKLIMKKLYGQKLYFIPEQFREALLSEFYKTYEKEKSKMEQETQDKNDRQSVFVGGKSQNNRASSIESLSNMRQDFMTRSLSPRGTTADKAKKRDGTADSKQEQQQSKSQLLDEDTRIYLKRLRKAAPDANVTLPDGFYDTDDEREARERALLEKKFSSRNVVYHCTDDDGSEGEPKRVVKRPRVRKTASSKLRVSAEGQKLLQKQKWGRQGEENCDRQVLEARSITKSDKKLENAQLNVIGQISSFEIKRNPIAGLKSVDTSIESNSSQKCHSTQEQELVLMQSTSTNHEANNQRVISEFTNDKIVGRPVVHREGGIVEDPRKRKRTTSAIVKSSKQRVASALDAIRGNINEQSDYCLDSKRLTQHHQQHRQKTDMSTSAHQAPESRSFFEAKKDSNFPLRKFTACEPNPVPLVAAMSPHESAQLGQGIAKDEPEFTDSILYQGLGQQKGDYTQSDAKLARPNRRLVSGKPKNFKPLQQKKMSEETLVIGGLVKQRNSHFIQRNKSALAKEYHQRHTRHIRGQSAINNQKQAVNAAPPSRLETKQATSSNIFKKSPNASQLYSSIKDDKSSTKVPDSVLEWYNEKIGPLYETQKVKTEMSFIDEGPDGRKTAADLNSTTVFNPRGSSHLRFSSKSSVGQTIASQAAKKVALVGQQSQFTTILNHDLANEDFDFAFTVQGKRDLNRIESLKNSQGVNDFNMAHAIRESKKSFGIYSTQGNQQTRSLNNSLLSPEEITKANALLQSHLQTTFDANLKDFKYATATQSNGDLSSHEASRNYNWLTGANMTKTNIRKLTQFTQDMGLNQTSALVHDVPRRQLLVNQSVLKRNSLYKREKVTTATQVREDTVPSTVHGNTFDRCNYPNPMTRLLQQQDHQTPTGRSESTTHKIGGQAAHPSGGAKNDYIASHNMPVKAVVRNPATTTLMGGLPKFSSISGGNDSTAREASSSHKTYYPAAGNEQQHQQAEGTGIALLVSSDGVNATAVALTTSSANGRQPSNIDCKSTRVVLDGWVGGAQSISRSNNPLPTGSGNPAFFEDRGHQMQLLSKDDGLLPRDGSNFYKKSTPQLLNRTGQSVSGGTNSRTVLSQLADNTPAATGIKIKRKD